MEEGMANQERARGRIFPISAPPRERTAPPVLPRPFEKPSPVSPEPGKPPKKKPLIQRFVNSLALRIILAGTALGGTGYAVYQEVPAVHRAIDNLIGVDTVPSVPPTFDNTKDKGVIGNNNIAKLSQAEIDKQFPSAFERLGDGKNTLQLQYPFDLSQSTDPNTKLTFTKSFSGSSSAERQQYKNRDFYDMFTFQNVPGGTVIRSPVDGYLVISIDENNPPDLNWGNATDGFINFVAPNGNQYGITFFGATTKDLRDGRYGNTQTGYIFKSLVDAPTYKTEYRKRVTGNYGIAVKKGEPILQLIQPPDNDTIGEVGFSIGPARQGEIGKSTDMGKPSIPTNIELLVTPDGKLISPQ